MRLSLAADDLFIVPPKWFFVKPYFLEAFELSELGHPRSFSEQTGTFSASIGSFQGLPAEALEVLLLPQRLALKYNTTPPPPCQHFLTDFFIFFLALLKNVHFLVFNVLFLRKKAACTFLHRRPYITSIIKLADLDTQLELQVAEDLLDRTLHFFCRDFLLRIGQR